MRGVEKQHSSTITSAMLGTFRENETRDEFLALIHPRHSTFSPEIENLFTGLAAGRV
jgi:hypothetical protein